MQRSNFSFLRDEWPTLSDLGELAEQNLYRDPNTTLVKLRMFGEQIVDYIFAYDNLEEPVEDSQFNRLKILEREELITGEILEIFHTLRQEGNEAVHNSYGTLEDAKTVLSLAFRLGVWFMQIYGKWDFEPEEFILPDRNELNEKNIDKLSKAYEQKLDQLQKELKILKNKQQTISDINLRKEKNKKFIANLALNDDEVNKIKRDDIIQDNSLSNNKRKFIITDPLGTDDEEEEAKIWNAVCDSFRPNECMGYWRYPLFSKRGEDRKEPDILIIDKELGLVVIEVSELTIDQVDSIEEFYQEAED
ncbi:DUF4145 domain-containing protein [Selenihalanaerobacter shriftii]|uniref:DUF4145 domain-containing protein n=1 Tax=Selenihalanaerobacter shriftii TaxID=142842 RepID=A0A1T4NFX0_9FIRM|nr:DUF4145 domain-containing protein [Selenihalanaerobacter shriftii]SJZ78159.1 protein of unknown function [Selenihalanaerobacter shriftii]